MNTQKEQIASQLPLLKNVLLSTLDKQLFFNELGRYIQDIFAMDQVMIFEAHEDGSSSLVVKKGLALEAEQMIAKGKGLVGYVTRTKRAYYSNNIKRDPLFSDSTYDLDVNAELSVPVIVNSMVFATVHLQSTNATRNFGQDEINLLNDLFKNLEKPISNLKMYLSSKQLNEILMQKIEKQEKELENSVHQPVKAQASATIVRPIIGNSTPMCKIFDLIKKVAPTDASILIEGDSGTGKELIARKIHNDSKRKDAPFIIINCGSMQETLLESELFGHEKGAFTGAVATKQGLVELAHGGTLFLDEIGELSLGMQTKLLRFLQEGEATRIGSKTPYHVNVRLISATNRVLREEIKNMTFREDLYYRINTISITAPALRERGDDIVKLAEYFLNLNKEVNDHKILTPNVIKILKEHTWPGNVRELQNVMERAFILAETKFIEERHLAASIKENKPVKVEEKAEYSEVTLVDLEKRHICNTLEHLRGNKTKTAKVLGITVKTLYNKLHTYGMIVAKEELV